MSNLPENKTRLANMLKALGNPVRFQIMETLAKNKTCITNQIVATTELAQSTVSQHLKVLREAGLIHGEVDGPATCYCINPQGVTWLKEQIENWLPNCCSTGEFSNPSRLYFEQNAGQWDTLRSGYFSEAVRESAIRKAYLHPEMVAADIGAGTGFMAQGLAPRVRHVHLVDGSGKMLEIARRNLAGVENASFHEADGLKLPFADEELDVAFANMYLHHCPDPLAAIQEMTRVLKPGGRLVITDMDVHENAWFREEMADTWLGFERSQVQDWFDQAGLVNVIVDCSGESCCATRNDNRAFEAEKAQVSIFLAVGTRRTMGVREAVQSAYGARAETGGCCSSGQTSASTCCSSESSRASSQLLGLDETAIIESSCCGNALVREQVVRLEQIGMDAVLPTWVQYDTGYSEEQRLSVPEEAAGLALGCGNPTALANIRPGETVLDIGSGAGMDALLAGQAVGEAGRVIGVDMTPQMLERARANAKKTGMSWVEFRQGEASSLPVESGTVDVVLSNCVINLVEDKGKVFKEIARVLRPGGRLEISDMVFARGIPASLHSEAKEWAGCVNGALPEAEYLDLIAAAGMGQIQVQRTKSGGAIAGVPVYSVHVSARK
jgi:ubiquinone/menaquinone biosynthesis C-methylase UbiE/DNA-binding HxlR family transcriptional regulator